MSWEQIIEKYGKIIEKRLEVFLAENIKQADNYHPFIGKVYADIEEFILRKGKRLAACSTLLIYKGYTGEVNERILNICVGIELYRHAILVHDDLVDMDDTRRGGSSLQKKFMNNYSPYNNRFGDGTAVFAGNIIYALAFRAIIDSEFPQEAINKVLRLTSTGFQDVNESQILDLLFEQKDVSVDEWTIMASKRAVSLFKVTLLTGAILANAPESDLSLFERIAENIGYSFDIQDDIIDTFAKKEEYGRSTCLDISKNKKPLHIIHALNSKDPKKAKALKCLLGKQFLSFGEKDLAKQILRESGGLEKAKQTLKKYSFQARTLIMKTSLTIDVKEFFNNFIHYIEQSLDWYN
jgi:geranylgeranyl pyrophosphate synthase